MARVLAPQEAEALRARAHEQVRQARRIRADCAELRVRLTRQAAELAALGVTSHLGRRRSR